MLFFYLILTIKFDDILKNNEGNVIVFMVIKFLLDTNEIKFYIVLIGIWMGKTLYIEKVNIKGDSLVAKCVDVISIIKA